MTKISWLTNDALEVGGHQVARVPAGTNGGVFGTGIRPNSNLKLAVKKLLYPLYRTRRYLLIDGFIEREIKRLIEKYVQPNDTYLEIGCGDMSTRKCLPKGVVFNALDIELSEFHLRRVLDADNNVNVVLASATKIPVESNTVSVIVSMEALTEIPEVDEVFEEMRRVLKPGAKFICSISNGRCYKYKVKGQNPYNVNAWSFEEFVSLAESHGFKLLEGSMKGLWVPLPTWLTSTSYDLPITSKSEFYNSVLFFAFEVSKD